METEKKEFHFDFGVSYITEAQAEELLDEIVSLVEDMDAWMGGGYSEYTWIDLVAYRVTTFLYSWRNRLLGKGAK